MGSVGSVVFVDLNESDPCYCYFPGRNCVFRVSKDCLVDFLRDCGVRVVFCEGSLMARVLSDFFDVYIVVSGQRGCREMLGLSKSHENDARLLYLAWRSGYLRFHRFPRRLLPFDPLVYKYIVLCRERARAGFMVSKFKPRFFGDIREFYVDFRGWVDSLARRLRDRITRRYRWVFDLVGVRGLGPYYIYFLMLIPELKYFSSKQRFLRYLGLKGVCKETDRGKRSYSVKARTALRIAAERANAYDLGLNEEPKKKPFRNWIKARKLAKKTYDVFKNYTRDNLSY